MDYMIIDIAVFNSISIQFLFVKYKLLQKKLVQILIFYATQEKQSLSSLDR